MARPFRILRPAHLAFGLAAFAGLAAPTVARAQGSTAKAAAEALFEEGRRLMAEGKPVEACPKFADSERIEPSAGTLLNLASCYEKSDRPASAWSTYKEAASLASSLGRTDLVAAAQRHAEALGPTLPRLNVTVAAPVDGMTVKIDGFEVARAAWGVAVPVDPGNHTIDARAPAFKPYETKVTLTPEPKTVTVSVPALESDPNAVVAAVPGSAAAAPPAGGAEAAAAATQPTTGAEADEGSARRTQRTAGVIVGAAGVVAMGVGGIFALNAKSKYDDSLTGCPSDPNVCTADGVSKRDSARSSGNLATVFLGAGAVALAGGIVLWATAPAASEGVAAPSASAPKTAASGARVELVPALGGAMVRGAW